jgi:hypothetical protein
MMAKTKVTKKLVKKEDPKKLTKLDLGMALFALAEKGVKTVIMRYSGGGDSGSIEEIEAEDRYEKTINESELKRWNEIKLALEEWGYKRLENTEGDWINNEGGSGTFTIQVPSGDYELAHSINVTKDFNHSGVISEELAD